MTDPTPSAPKRSTRRKQEAPVNPENTNPTTTTDANPQANSEPPVMGEAVTPNPALSSAPNLTPPATTTPASSGETVQAAPKPQENAPVQAKPEPKRIAVKVLKNMTYLEGRFYNAGQTVTVARLFAQAAIKDGSAELAK